jgi:HK97 gp10 family phage protein
MPAKIVATVRLNMPNPNIGEMLRELPDKVVTRKLAAIQKKLMQEIQERAKELVPVDTGRLRETIIVKAGFNKQQGVVFSAVGLQKITWRMRKNIRKKKEAGTISKTALESDAYYGKFVELGAPGHNQKPEPFLRPAFDEQHVTILNEYKKEVSDVLEAEFRKMGKANF